MPLTVIDPIPALVVIDLQRGIVDAPGIQPAARVVLERSAALAAAFRARGLPVVLVNVTGAAPGRTDRNRVERERRDRDRADRDRADPARSGSRPEATSRQESRADLAEELDVQPGDHLVTKERRNAFHGTGLDELLRGLSVTQVVMSGISTTSGVEGTARAAYDYGYHVVVAIDAVTDGDPVAHLNSIERIFPKLGETATTDEILAMLPASR